MLTEALREQIISIIDDVQGMTIATVREDGYPQATTVSYYLKKFPQIAQYFSMETENVALFRVEPKVISVIDYSKGFGHTELVIL